MKINQKRLLKPLFAILIAVIFAAVPYAHAQQTWTGNNNSTDWSDPGNWSGGVPTAADDVIIPAALSFYPVLTVASFAKSIDMAAATSLTTSNFDLTVTNGITGLGTMTSNGSTINAGAGVATTAFTGNASTEVIGGDFTMLTSFTGNFSSLTIGGNCTTGTTFTAGSGTINITGNFILGTTFSGGSSVVNIGGNFTLGTSFTGASSNVHLAGNFFLGTTFTGSLSTFTLNGTTAQNINGASAPITFNDLVIANSLAAVSTSINIIPTNTTINVLSILIPDAVNTIGGIVTDNGTIEVTATGNTDDLATQYFGILALQNGITDFEGITAQNLGAHTMGYLVITNTSGTTLTGNIVVLKNLTGSGTLLGSAFTATIGGNMAITTFTPNTSTIIFNGSAAQSSGVGTSQSFFNFTMNNSSGGVTIISNGSATVNNVLTLTNGNLISDAADPVIFSATANPFSGGSDNSYISGPAENNGLSVTNTSFTFPVGNGGKFAPAAISGIISAADFTIQYFKSAHTANASGISGSAKASTVEYWTTIENAGGIAANLTLNWEDAAFSGILAGQVSNIKIYNDHGGATWVSESGTPTGTGGTGGSGSVTSTGIPVGDFASGGFFTFGDNSGVNPLPVTLVSFNAQYENNAVNLNWSTASEINNHYFEAGRSIDGQNWETIAQVEGHGNSLITQNYFTVDNLASIIPSGTLYYRLKQVDFNGTSEYSMIRSVTLNNMPPTVSIYPNPANNMLNINWSSDNNDNTTIKLVNITGSTIYSENISGKGLMNKSIDLSIYPAGTYFLQLVSDKKTSSQVVLKN